jgi:methyl-accepting chemotaxis protein
MSTANLLQQSFAAVAPHSESLLDFFYQTLFERYPEVRPMFDKTDMKKQKGKLLASLALVVKHADSLQEVSLPLRRMGARHTGYGVKPEHYPAVGECLLAALSKVAGPLWNEALAAAWSGAYQWVAGEMLQGAEQECGASLWS